MPLSESVAIGLPTKGWSSDYPTLPGLFCCEESFVSAVTDYTKHVDASLGDCLTSCCVEALVVNVLHREPNYVCFRDSGA